MFRQSFALVALLALGSLSTAQKTTKDDVPKKVADLFKSTVEKVKETPGEVTERKPGEFQKVRQVASSVKVTITKSDYDDKPYKARIVWDGQQQESKIFGEKEKAEKSKDWLEVGKVAGRDNLSSAPQRFEAVYYYVGDKWVLDDISWSNLSPRGATPVRGEHAGTFTVKAGLKTPWTAVLGEPTVAEKK